MRSLRIIHILYQIQIYALHHFAQVLFVCLVLWDEVIDITADVLGEGFLDDWPHFLDVLEELLSTIGVIRTVNGAESVEDEGVVEWKLFDVVLSQ